MTRVSLLVGAALVAEAWLCPSGVSRPMLIESGLGQFGTSEDFAAADGLADTVAAEGAGAAKASATLIPRIAREQVVSWAVLECTKTTGSDPLIAVLSSDPVSPSAPDFVATPVEGFVVSFVFDGAPLPPSFDGFQVVATGRLDDLIKIADETGQRGAWWLGGGDIYVRDAVPVLAALAGLVAVLLVLGLARRRRRTAWARRIKRSTGRQRPRSPS